MGKGRQESFGLCSCGTNLISYWINGVRKGEK